MSSSAGSTAKTAGAPRKAAAPARGRAAAARVQPQPGPDVAEMLRELRIEGEALAARVKQLLDRSP